MKKRMILPAITALALLVAPGLVREAQSGVRVKATLRTPNLTVRVGNTPGGFHGRMVRKPLPVRRVVRHFAVTRHDRKIAARLEWYTGVPASEMLFLKSRGYGWYDIGRWLGVGSRTVSASMRLGTWKQFLRAERYARCGRRCGDGCGHHGGYSRVVYEERMDDYDIYNR